MVRNRFICQAISFSVAVLTLFSCSKDRPEETPEEVWPSLETNQPRLNEDIGMIKDVVNVVNSYGYATYMSLQDMEFRLAGKSETYTVNCTDDDSGLNVFAAKDADNKWYWKYTTSGYDDELWLMNGTSKVPVNQVVTPLFRTADGNVVQVSFDNGVKYENLLDFAGEAVVLSYAKHSGLFMNVDTDRGSFVLTMTNGMELKIPNRPDQRAALEAIYDATDGDNWAHKEGWKESADIEDWYGVSCDGEGNVVDLNLKENRLKGSLPDVFAAFPYCSVINFENSKETGSNNNVLTGQLPQSMLTYVETQKFYLRRNRLAVTEFYVPNKLIENAITAFVAYPQCDHSFRVHINSAVDGTGQIRPHNTAFLKHAATEGKGVDIFIMGDGYDAENHTIGGVVDYWFDVAYETIFSVDPMNKLKKYFNVWYIYGHSPERGVSLFGNKRNSIYGYHHKSTGSSACEFDKNAIAATIQEALGGKPVQDGTTVMMCVHHTANAHTHGMMYSPSVHINGSARELCIGFVPTRSSSFRGLVHHEYVGHAYGRLRDEYGDETSPKHANPKQLSNLTDNVDWESRPNYCKWSDFYKDSRYAFEEIDCYPGALNYSNVYRPTKQSIMTNSNNRSDRFNAPSRAAIYRKTMYKAFDDWEYDHEEFVKFDLGL